MSELETKKEIMENDVDQVSGGAAPKAFSFIPNWLPIDPDTISPKGDAHPLPFPQDRRGNKSTKL